jgi:hypothetical protein
MKNLFSFIPVGFRARGCGGRLRPGRVFPAPGSSWKTPTLTPDFTTGIKRSAVHPLKCGSPPHGPSPDVTVNKTACSRQSACRLNVQAWNNKGSTTPVGLLLVFCHGGWAIWAKGCRARLWPPPRPPRGAPRGVGIPTRALVRRNTE